ncbi:hypothetical protein C8R44DRAFT_984009 [Mycena epipterygia]|nr:hypothetical protein C8R44DRAFT_984009 [Mycena epipterygia]
MREFAQELVDHVIDHWYLADPDGMKPCGLVCKRWLPRSRYNFFSIVHLDAGILSNLSKLLDVIDASDFPILACIQHLRFRFPPFDEAELARLHQCPNLSRIETCVLNFDRRNSLLLQTHLRAWSASSISLSHLDLSFPNMELPLRAVLDLTSCVPSLETLVLGVAALLKDTTVQPASGPTQLVHLDINGRQVGLFFSCLLSPRKPILRTLRISGHLQRADGELIDKYFERAGEGLETLAISSYPWSEVLQCHIFQHATKLRSLTFTCTTLFDIPDTLALLPESTLTVIRVTVHYRAHEDENWVALDDLLAAPSFPALEKFSIFLDGGSMTRGLITPAVRDLMPLANTRGILH